MFGAYGLAQIAEIDFDRHIRLARKGKHIMSAEEQAVLDTILEMTKAFENKNIDRVMNSYGENAVVMFRPEAPVRDRAEIKANFEQFFTMSPKFTYTAGHEVIIAGDSAVHIAPWTMTATAPDGTAIQDSGLSVATLERQKNGKWLLVIDNPHGSRLEKK